MVTIRYSFIILLLLSFQRDLTAMQPQKSSSSWFTQSSKSIFTSLPSLYQDVPVGYTCAAVATLVGLGAGCYATKRALEKQQRTIEQGSKEIDELAKERCNKVKKFIQFRTEEPDCQDGKLYVKRDEISNEAFIAKVFGVINREKIISDSSGLWPQGTPFDDRLKILSDQDALINKTMSYLPKIYPDLPYEKQKMIMEIVKVKKIESEYFKNVPVVGQEKETHWYYVREDCNITDLKKELTGFGQYWSDETSDQESIGTALYQYVLCSNELRKKEKEKNIHLAYLHKWSIRFDYLQKAMAIGASATIGAAFILPPLFHVGRRFWGQ